MLYYNFYGYERFKACFGLEKRDNGTVVRKNRILLNHLKNPALLRYCREPLSTSSITERAASAVNSVGVS